jgi:hypothetical protein
VRIGLTAAGNELAAALQQFPSIATCRVFGPPGSGIPAWTQPAMTMLRHTGVTPWVSFKDWASDGTAATALKRWLTDMPGDVPSVYLTYHHEPQGNLDPRDYRRRWNMLANTVRTHRNSDRVVLVPIDVLYPSRRKIWDRYSSDWTKWVGIWQQWAPTDSAGRYVGDLMGWDCYLETTATRYESPESFFRVPIGAAHTMGVPLAIPELGAIRTPSDLTGAGRAEWISSCLTYLAQHDTKIVSWWHATGSAGHNYRLDDAPSAKTWRDAVIRSRL